MRIITMDLLASYTPPSKDDQAIKHAVFSGTFLANYATNMPRGGQEAHYGLKGAGLGSRPLPFFLLIIEVCALLPMESPCNRDNARATQETQKLQCLEKSRLLRNPRRRIPACQQMLRDWVTSRSPLHFFARGRQQIR